MKSIRSVFILVTIFSIAIAFMESAVVIYLREIVYPEGFKFPLNPIQDDLILTEFLREAATLIILLMIGLLAGKTFSQNFAWFIYTFAIWDIFYYVFLKILINWPESLFTWDILFLIPTTWTGPVISPVIVSLTLILIAVVILYFAGKGADTKILIHECGIFIIGCMVLFLSFIWDYSRFILQHFSLKEILIHPDRQSIYNTAITYVPEKFNWALFAVGELIVLLMVFIYYLRVRRKLHYMP